MDDKEASRLERELKQMREEIRLLRHTMIVFCVGIVVIAVLMFPQITLATLVLAAIVLIVLLISPARRQVFPYLFNKQDKP